MKAIRRFVAHKDGMHRWFNVGDEIPDDWASVIGDSPVVAGGNSPDVVFAEFGGLVTAVQVVGWVMSEDDDDTRAAKARHALDAELEGKNRTTVVEPLEELLASV